MTSVSHTAKNLSVETGQYRECISGCNLGLDVKNSGSGLDVRIFSGKIRLSNKSDNPILRAFSDSGIDVMEKELVLLMDLRRFYLDNVTENEYYYYFYDLIANINKTYNVFENEQETENYNFEVYDIEEAIDNFKTSCQPENDNPNKEYDAWFYLTLFYLYKCGYVIEEFPRLVEHPPKERYDFTYKAVRNKMIELGQDENGTVRYAVRRVFISNLTFTQKNATISLNETIEAKFKEISNRQASFVSMSTDEKLAEIANLIENMLKRDGKFLTLDYSSVCFDFVDDSTIRNYRKKIQCFRHSASESIIERSSFTNEQKCFMIDYGLTIIKVIHFLTEE